MQAAFSSATSPTLPRGLTKRLPRVLQNDVVSLRKNMKNTYTPNDMPVFFSFYFYLSDEETGLFDILARAQKQGYLYIRNIHSSSSSPLFNKAGITNYNPARRLPQSPGDDANEPVRGGSWRQTPPPPRRGTLSRNHPPVSGNHGAS